MLEGQSLLFWRMNVCVFSFSFFVVLHSLKRHSDHLANGLYFPFSTVLIESVLSISSLKPRASACFPHYPHMGFSLHYRRPFFFKRTTRFYIIAGHFFLFSQILGCIWVPCSELSDAQNFLKTSNEWMTPIITKQKHKNVFTNKQNITHIMYIYTHI